MTEWIFGFVVRFVNLFANLISWAILIHIILSWFSAKRTPIGAALEGIVRPLYKPFAWANYGGFSFAPIVVLLLVDGVRFGIIWGLQQLMQVVT